MLTAIDKLEIRMMALEELTNLDRSYARRADERQLMLRDSKRWLEEQAEKKDRVTPGERYEYREVTIGMLDKKEEILHLFNRLGALGWRVSGPLSRSAAEDVWILERTLTDG